MIASNWASSISFFVIVGSLSTTSLICGGG